MQKETLVATLVTPEWLAKIAREVHKTSCEKGWWGENANPETNKIHTREFGEIMMLATSELSEALEVYREGTDIKKVYWSKTAKEPEKKSTTTIHSDEPVNGWKPEGFPIEIADFIIRNVETMAAACMDVATAFQFVMLLHEQEKVRKKLVGIETKSIKNIPSALARTNYWIARAEDMFWEKRERREPVTFSVLNTVDGSEQIGFFLASAVNQAILLCQSTEIDIRAAVLMKMEYNSTRPYKHGGKIA